MPSLDNTSLPLDNTVPRLLIDAGDDPFGKGKPKDAEFFDKPVFNLCQGISGNMPLPK